MAADSFITEVWTTRGLVTYYTAFVIELQSRRVQVLGPTPYPHEAFVIQCLREVTGEAAALLREGRMLVCDRDPKWSRAVEQWVSAMGVRVIRTPPCAPNCNAHAERFVRSVKEECLNRVVPLGEWHLRRTLREFVTHYHRERNHQGLANELIDCLAAQRPTGAVHLRQRVGGILNYYYRSAAKTNWRIQDGTERPQSGVDFRPHDLRRTAAPLITASGVSRFPLKRTLNPM